MVIFGPRGGLVALGLFAVGAPILKLIFGNTSFGRKWVKTHPGWTSWSSGGGGGGWSGGGSSGGGFSGGGGSFGGGGASGSW